MFPSKYPFKLCAFYDDINTGFSWNLAFFSEIKALETFDNQSDDINLQNKNLSRQTNFNLIIQA